MVAVHRRYGTDPRVGFYVAVGAVRPIQTWQILFLCHYLGWSFHTVMHELTAAELKHYIVECIDLHNKLNAPAPSK